MLTTKALCKKLRLADTKKIHSIAAVYHWEHEARGGGKGFRWFVTEEDIEQYHADRIRERIPLPVRRKQLNDVIDKWDMAFSGRTFPNHENQIKLKKKPSHINSLGK